ncbi:MAG: helix-turn-helix transcriptional regulator [Mycobacterium sp.]|uniref:helix-turn-helix transcriptional regulator n=1 Tax=Mycobacterium sp. TaxID=1785 RepID=UPI003F98D5D9
MAARAPGRSNKLHTTPTGSSLKPPRWADINEVAEYLGLTPRGIREMRRDGRIRSYRLGYKTVRYDLNEIDAALRASNGNGAA